MSKCKTKAIQTALGTFRHTQAYTGIIHHIQAHSEPCVTLTYLEPWYIQNPDVLRTLAYAQPRYIRTPVYSERWYIQNSRHIQNPVKHQR